MKNEVKHVLTILAFDDLERAVLFYDEIFRFPKEIELPVFVEYRLPGGSKLGLYKRESFGANIGQLPELTAEGGITGTELYFFCSDLEQTIEQITGAGGKLLSGLSLRGWGDEVAYFADPEGNVIALARQRE